MTAVLPAWWQRLAERAARAPACPRHALWIDGAASPIGSIEPALAERLRADKLPLVRQGVDGERLCGAPDAVLGQVACWLRDQGLASKWRDELLTVTDADGAPHGAIERAAVRPLGIATFAVHLIGFTSAGAVWVQQRALDKATDPGQWDTLVGGLVSADEGSALALERETWEEAGLRVSELDALQPIERLTIRRPVIEGYMVEHIDVFEAVLPEGATPLNRDGEVERFECVAPEAQVKRLSQGRFTLEAALMLAASLRRRGLL